MGDWRGAERDLLRALDAHRHGKTKRNIGLDLNNLGNIYIRIGDWERAENALNESLQIVRAHKNLRSVFFVLSSLRHLRCRQGDLFGAEQFAREALALYTSLGLSDKRIALHCVETLAIAAAADKRWEQAACLFGILDTWQPSERDTDPSRDPELYHRQRRAALSAVEPDVWEHYQRNARELSWEHVTDFALFLK
jgi:tetratricopeptide (TPR) repeat protein